MPLHSLALKYAHKETLEACDCFPFPIDIASVTSVKQLL